MPDAVLPTTATICCTSWVNTCLGCSSTNNLELQCWAACHLLLLSFFGWAHLPAGLQQAILAVHGTGCDTRAQCCSGQPGTALTQAVHRLQVLAAGCAVAKCSPAVTGVSAPG